MKKLFGLALLSGLSLYGQYTYRYSTDFAPSINAADWTSNGQILGGGTLNTTTSGSVIGKSNVATLGQSGELAFAIHPTTGGAAIAYLRASQNAHHSMNGAGGAITGQYFALVFGSFTFDAAGGCKMTVNLFQRDSAATLTLLTSKMWSCRDNMAVRVFDNGSIVALYIDGIFAHFYSYAVAQTGGSPGVGVANQSSPYTFVTGVKYGNADTTAPTPSNAAQISSAAVANEVDLNWPGFSDGSTGTGVVRYNIYRSDSLWSAGISGTNVSDTTVQPNQTYTYLIQGVDHHWNWSPTIQITVQTPATGDRNVRQVGVRVNGAYWGGAGEQIDMRSGNLNFTVPIVTAQSRGLNVGFALNYNSQLWRKDSNTDVFFGRDTGFGLGWRLLAGSITPVYSGAWILHHFTYTDSTGAEYRLDQNLNNAGVWSSKDGVYIAYDSNTDRLYFPDGTFWEMSAVSGGEEQDAGTRYPALIQDARGNQIKLRYAMGKSSYWDNSSGRLTEIEDARAVAVPAGGSVYKTYSIAYTADNHISTFGPHIGSGEFFNFAFSPSPVTVSSPFGAGQAGTYSQLIGLTRLANVNHLNTNFSYNASGEMLTMTTPFGGQLRWAYRSFTFNGSRTQREVNQRYIRYSDSASETRHDLFWADTADATSSGHSEVWLNDVTAGAWRNWVFNVASNAQWAWGFPTQYRERSQKTTGDLLQMDYGWTTDAWGNVYQSFAKTTLDGNSALSSKTETTRDVFGNVTQEKVYDYGATVAGRTFNYAYRNDTAYLQRYMRNLLSTKTLTVVGTVTLLTNTYDNGSLTSVAGARQWVSPGTTFVGLVTGVQGLGKDVSIQYDQAGNVVKTTDNTDNTYSSVAITSTTNYVAPSSATPGTHTNLTTTMTYTSYLAPATISDPNNATSKTFYDSWGRVSSTQVPAGAYTTYTYDYPARQITATTGTRWSRSTLDGFGRTTLVELGTGSTGVSKVSTEYAPCGCSPLGKLYRTSQPYAATGTASNWTTYSYDSRGRTTTVTLPGTAGSTLTAYTGSTVRVTDPAGKWKESDNNVFGKVVKLKEPNPAAGANFKTTYTYNEMDQLLTVTMPRPVGTGTTTQTRTFVYDANYRLQSVTLPESGTTTYSYNPNGTLLRKQDAKGQKVEYGYDDIRRLIAVNRYKVGDTLPDICQSVGFTWDSVIWGGDATYPTYSLGRLTEAYWGKADADPLKACPGGEYLEQYLYDTFGNLAEKRLRVGKYGSPAQGLIYGAMRWAGSYDSEARLLSERYPMLSETSPYSSYVNYLYDSVGRLQGSQSATCDTSIYPSCKTPVDMVTVNSFNAAGQPTSMSWLGTTQTLQYNVLNQLTRATSTAASNLNALDLEYRYPATGNNGQISSQVNWTAQEEVAYQYDSLRRLTTMYTTTSTATGQNYTYDGFGNMTMTTKPGYGDAPQFTAAADTTNNHVNGFGYDANGNVTQMGSQTFTYDVENRLSGNYSYDASNRRVWDGSNYTMWTPDGRRMGRYTVSPDFWQHWVGSNYVQEWRLVFSVVGTTAYFGGKVVAEGVYNISSLSWSPVVTDRLGSVRVRGTQNLSYYPYGDERVVTANGSNKFATYFRDSSGLDYANQRYYAQATGRFMTADPSGAGLNLYRYAGSDPINRLDPSGLQPECADFGLCFDTPDDQGTGSGGGSPSPTPVGVPSLPPPPSGIGGPGPNSAPVWMGFNSQDGATARRAQDMANDWVRREKCDHALRGFGVNSVGDELGKIRFSGSGQNVWNGRNSTFVANFKVKGAVVRLPTNTFFAMAKSTTGAVVASTQWGYQMFLGYAFFDPSLAGVKRGYEDAARALMIMHEAIHLGGFGDDVFGGSKQLSAFLIDNCYPVIKSYLGGLTQ